MKTVGDVFKQIVSIDSPSGEERKIREFIIRFLKDKKYQPKTDKRGNVYLKIKGKGEPFLFCAHMDTVEPGKGIKVIEKNGFFQSNGKTILGADNKAFLAAILWVLGNVNIKRNLEIIFSVKEEVGGGVEFFPFEWIKSKIGFIFDNANPLGGIVLRSPYITNFHAQFIGKAAHASTPEKGRNALLALIKGLSALSIGKINNGNTLINIGLIQGGTGINTIPEKASVSGEIRSYDKKVFNFYLTKIKRIFFTQAKKNQIKLIFKTDGYSPGYIHKKTDPIIKKIALLFKEFNLKPIFYRFSGISDANILNEKGIKTIVFSDGVVNPHTVKERIAIDDLEKIKNIIIRLINEKRFYSSAK